MSEMQRLTTRDLRSVLRAVEVLHGGAPDSAAGARIGTAIQEAIACDLLSIDTFTPQCALVGHVWSDQSWDPIILRYVEGFVAHLHEHPLFEAARQDGIETARRISDIASSESFKRLGIYNEFFRLLHLDRQLAVGISGRLVTIIGLNRSGTDFRVGERRVLQALRPYCVAAIETEKCMMSIAARHEALEQALEVSAMAAILVSTSGRVRLMTAAARGLLEVLGYGPVRTDVLPDELLAWLRAQLQQDAGALPVPSCAARLTRNGCSVDIRLIRQGGAGHLLLLDPRAAPAATQRIEATAAVARLTLRETEVLRWVDQGMRARWTKACARRRPRGSTLRTPSR